MTMSTLKDLSYKPIINDSPKKLTQEQISFYNENGYVGPFPIFSPAGVEENRLYFDYLLSELSKPGDGRDAYAINCYQTRCGGIWDLCMNEQILDYVEDLVGPDIIAWASHYFAKLPNDPKSVPWHQDASYWPLTPARTVTAWLAIDDADRGNAAMQFIPGTHNMGHIEWEKTTKQAVLDQEIKNIESLGKPIYDEMPAGWISLHADMLVHGSEANTSNRRRCGLTMRYCPPEVRAINDGWARQSIICRGSDPANYWSHYERPAGDDLSLENKPKPYGAN
jgi:non-haem Fe2+, alpha-ketoglutarate-dependent halogenase